MKKPLVDPNPILEHIEGILETIKDRKEYMKSVCRGEQEIFPPDVHADLPYQHVEESLKDLWGKIRGEIRKQQ